MKHSKALALGIVLVLGTAAGTFVSLSVHTRRSVQAVSAPPPAPTPVAFDSAQSTALFVGVRKFTHDEITELPYAVDDAVDLAWTFAFDRRVHLVSPDRIVLALSGKPAKPESQQRLRELKQAGADVEPAQPSDIVALLHKQAALAGKGGLLIASFASHGFARDGIGYILGASSLVRYPETNLSTAALLDIIAASEAQRSLVFIDACRERLTEGMRGPSDPTHALSTLNGRMRRVRGQAIFYAAAAGQYAYDGDGNGVFTKAVLDGLNCNASAPRGAVTAETLSSYVDRNVRDWIRKHRDPSAGAGIQWSFDGEAKNMPMALCWQPPGRTLDGSAVARTSFTGSTLSAFTADGTRLWQKTLDNAITTSQTADLDGDGQPEVIAATTRAITAFDHTGKLLWSAHEDGMPLRAFALGDVFRKHTLETVALWDAGAAASHLSLYAPDGQRLATYDAPSRFDHVTIGRPTTRHAPKIIAAGIDRSGAAFVAVFNPKKISTGKPLWSRRLPPDAERITRLATIDDHNGRTDIAVETAGGQKYVLDFDGNVHEQGEKRHPGGAATVPHRLQTRHEAKH